MSPLTTAEAIATLVSAHPQWFDDGRGAPKRPNPSATLIGTGESYAAWLVISREAADLQDRDGPRSVVVRVPHRPAELPRPMSEEFAALVAAPEGLGPRPIHLSAPGESLAQELSGATGGAADGGTGASAYMVVGRVPGQVRPPGAWTDDLLAAHARQLARLHEHTFDGHGDLTSTESLTPRLSMVESGESGMAWWREHHRDLATADDVRALWPRVQALFAATEPEFERLQQFALIHGDAAVPNILISGGVPRYVDWEWAHIGDPARDLAFIGGAVWQAPWYLRLDDTRFARYVQAYCAAVGPDADAAALTARARAWLVNETFFVALHFRRQAARTNDGEYAVRADTLLTRLSAALI